MSRACISYISSQREVSIAAYSTKGGCQRGLLPYSGCEQHSAGHSQCFACLCIRWGIRDSTLFPFPGKAWGNESGGEWPQHREESAHHT